MKEKTKKSKGKVLVATLSDTESDLSDEYEEECSNYMAFAAITDKVIVENISDNKDFFDDEVLEKLTIQEAYDKLCTKYIKSKKTSHLYRKELNEVKTEKANLLVKLDKTTRLVETLVVEKTSLDEKIKNLEIELSQARTQIERMPSAKLDEVLSVERPSSNKTCFGYVDSSGPSSSTAFGSKTVVVPQFEKVDKGKKSLTNMSNSKSFIRPYFRKSSSSKTTHVCHHCGVLGYTHPNCSKLYPHKQVSKRSQVSSQGPTPFLGEDFHA